MSKEIKEDKAPEEGLNEDAGKEPDSSEHEEKQVKPKKSPAE